MKITEVALKKWKGLSTTYKLDGPTAIVGPNGAGKTACLQAIVYALTGSTPAGKELGRVAQFFGSEGGTVTITDDAGHMLERGLWHDAKDHSWHEILETTVTDIRGVPAFAHWHADPHVLEVGALLALSDEEKRKRILSLCGSTAAVDGSGLIQAIGELFAQAVAGPAATLEVLPAQTGPALVRPGKLQLPCKDYAQEWPVICQQIGATLMGAHDVTQAFDRLTSMARDARIDASSDARSAKAAAEDLEAQAAGLANAQTLLGPARDESRVLHERWETAIAANAGRAELETSLTIARQQLDRAHDELTRAEGELRAAPEPPRLDDLPAIAFEDYGPRIKDLRERERQLQTKKTQIEVIKAQHQYAQCAVEQVKGRITSAEANVGNRILSLAAQIPDEVHPQMPRLRQLLEATYDQAQTTLRDARKRLALAEEELTVAQRAYDAIAAEESAIMPELERVANEVARLITLVGAQRKAADAAQEARRQAQRDIDLYTDRLRRVELQRAVVEEAARSVGDLTGRLAQMPEVDTDLKEQAARAQARVRELEGQAAAYRAYLEAIQRGIAARRREAAWKVAEDAIKGARRSVVADAAGPLCQLANAVYALMGREERMSIRLTSERERPICEMGVARNGSWTAAVALSAGELVLFQTALTVAVARLSGGLRLLLLEADPLDESNLAMLLHALRSLEDMDAVVVCTAREIDRADTEGWCVIEI